jgi:hypothetical protein
VAELKTKPTKDSVSKFLKTIEDPARREDSLKVAKILEEITGQKPRMWGTNIVGFGSYTYTNTTRKPAEWPLIGFSPRKQNLVLYLMPGFEKHGDLMAKLGNPSCGKSCFYMKRLDDFHLPTLKKLMRVSYQDAKKSLT